MQPVDRLRLVPARPAEAPVHRAAAVVAAARLSLETSRRRLT
jgi:hypothetical protein